MATSNGDEFLYFAKDQTEGEHGFKWCHVDLLRDEAGNAAIRTMQQTDFRLRRASQAREQMLVEIANLISQFLPERT
jgi:hypothetical protein